MMTISTKVLDSIRWGFTFVRSERKQCQVVKGREEAGWRTCDGR